MKAVIISGALAQDHEFIYPYYQFIDLIDCIIGVSVKGILELPCHQ